MAFLLDTNVVSELRKSTPHPEVLAWQRRNAAAEAYLSVLVIGEIRQGIERVRPRDARWAETLDDWFDGLLSTYRDRILPVTTEIAQEWGRYNVPPKATFISWNPRQMPSTGTPACTALRISGSVVASRAGS